MKKIVTLNDVRRARDRDDARREYRAEVKLARAKVRRWTAKVAKFGGDVQRETLARMIAKLESLTGRSAS